MSREGFFGLVFGFLFAALLGAVFCVGLPILVSLGGIAVLCGIIIAAVFKDREEKAPFWVGLAFGFGAMAVYFSLYTGVLSGLSEKYDGFSGTVTLEAVDFARGDGSFDAKIVSEKGSSLYLVRLDDYTQGGFEITPGSRFTASVNLRAPENTRRFSSLRFYRTERVYLVGYVSEISDFSEGELGIFNWHKYLRKGALDRISVLYGEKAYLMRGLLFGDKSGFTESFSSAASAAGVSHIFAVSGMHLSFLVSAVLLLGRRRSIKYIAVAVVLVFMAVTGFEPSVVRAGVMQIAALWAVLIGREGESFGSLGFALAVLLVANPCSVSDVGLQFSFCAVVGILVWGEKLRSGLFAVTKKLPAPLQKLCRPAVPAVAVSLSATVFTAPPSVLYFDRLSLVSAVSNIAVNWLVAAVFIAGMVSLILSCIWLPLGAGLSWITSLGVGALEFLIDLFANIPFAVLGAESVFVKSALAAAYGFGWLFFAKKARFALLKTLGVFCLGVGLAVLISFGASFGQLRLTVASSGGECTLISHGGSHIAVDATGEKLITLMQNRNIQKLDLLLLTFSHGLDETCADELISSGRVRRLGIAAYSGDRDSAEALIFLAKEKGIPVDILSCDREYVFGDVRLEVMVPASGGEGRGAGAVLCSYKGANALITGRVSSEGLSRITKTRDLPKTELLVLSSGESKARFSGELSELSRGGLVIVSGRRGRSGLFEEREVLYTSDIGNIDSLFFGGRIYIYN